MANGQVGAPSKLTPEEKVEVYKAFAIWIDIEDYPLITEFCLKDKTARKYDVTEDNLQDWPQFSNLRRKAIKKQEVYLDRGASSNRVNATFAIFKLKQPAFGWTDKQEHELSGGLTVDSSFNADKKSEFEEWLRNQQSTSKNT